MRWNLWIDRQPRPGWHNMAIDQTLLDLAAGQGLAILRLYRWNPFCLSFGRHEPAMRRYRRERIEALGVDVVRRPTGGRAVWHARELTYAVAAPGTLGGLRESYHRIHLALGEAVGALGARAQLAAPPARTPGPGAGACFALPVGGEVMVEGKKVVGSAQVRQGAGLLQHGSMLLEDDQRLVHELTGSAEGPAPEAPLSALLGRTVTFDEAAGAVVAATASWSSEWDVLDPGAVLAVAGAHVPRFRSDEWTWQR